jgi:PBP4 family serine-type D-alanyl-D-alanine carboxypeptidase
MNFEPFSQVSSCHFSRHFSRHSSRYSLALIFFMHLHTNHFHRLATASVGLIGFFGLFGLFAQHSFPLQAAPKAAPKVVAKAATKAVAKTAVKPPAKPAAKPVIKPAAKPVGKPLAKAAAKAVAKAVAKPPAKGGKVIAKAAKNIKPAKPVEPPKPQNPLLAALAGSTARAVGLSDHTTLSTNARPRLSSIDSAKALGLLRSAMDEVLSGSSFDKTELGAEVRSLVGNKSIYARNAASALIPASTTKLLPTFGALEQFGADYLVRTSVCTDAAMETNGSLRDGVLEGNVYLVGHGDPFLNISDLESLAVQLKNMGINRIRGNVYGDDSFFDRLMNRQEYSGDDDEVQPTGPISALSVQRNLITVIISAGSRAGDPVRVQTFPASDAFTFSVSARVVAARPARGKRGRRGGGARGGLEVRQVRANDATGKQHFVIAGTLSPNVTISKLFFIQNPPLTAADMFRKRMEMFSIAVEGKVALQKTPRTAAVLAEFVRPLGDIIRHINKKSDNFCAEHVFKMLGSPLVTGDNEPMFNETAEQRSAVASVKQIKTILKDRAIAEPWMINDGSGLSRRNRIPPSMLVHLLQTATRTAFAEEFRSSLSVAGLDGTLEHRMRGTPAEYNVSAKTGTHKNVSALAGYVKTKDGEKMAFSFMFNGWGVWHYKHTENRLCELLANFSYSEALGYVHAQEERERERERLRLEAESTQSTQSAQSSQSVQSPQPAQTVTAQAAQTAQTKQTAPTKQTAQTGQTAQIGQPTQGVQATQATKAPQKNQSQQ